MFNMKVSEVLGKKPLLRSSLSSLTALPVPRQSVFCAPRAAVGTKLPVRHTMNPKQMSLSFPLFFSFVLVEGRKGMCVKSWGRKRNSSTQENSNVFSPFPFTLVGVKLLCLIRSTRLGWDWPFFVIPSQASGENVMLLSDLLEKLSLG